MDHPHNELLFWTAEGGILPLIGILIIACSFLNMVWKTKLKRGWLYFTMLLPILVHTQLELPFYISTIHWFIFIFLIFMIDERYGYKHELDISNLSLFKGISLIFPLLVCIYMFTTLQSTRLLTKYERSGYKDPHLLSSIINSHALQKKYETLIMKLNLEIAKKTQNKSKLIDILHKVLKTLCRVIKLSLCLCCGGNLFSRNLIFRLFFYLNNNFAIRV